MSHSQQSVVPVLVFAIALPAACVGAEPASVVAPKAELVKVDGTYEFTEGPAADAKGNVYFSDVRAARCYYWSTDGKVVLWRDDTGNANGQAIDKAGNLLACEGGRGRVVSLDPQRHSTIVADQYQGKRFNQPNDLWIDPRGGVYFTDPVYGRGEKPQGGEHVYYVGPDRKQVVRVVSDMVRPNGLVGTPDGGLLYVSDHGAKQIYLYDINADGTLARKRLFAPVGADGMELDNEGNVYMADEGIVVYSADGRHLETVAVPERPTNLCFAGADGHTLFITARPAAYTLRMRTAAAASK